MIVITIIICCIITINTFQIFEFYKIFAIYKLELFWVQIFIMIIGIKYYFATQNNILCVIGYKISME